MMPKQPSPVERRQSSRFPIQQELRYRTLSKRGGDESGEGSTVNISSSGVLFTTPKVLLPGRRLEVSINWPAQLNQKCGLRLVARGRIVRYVDGAAAMQIQQYEFRTQAASSEPAGSARLSS